MSRDDDFDAFHHRLIEAGLLVPTGVDGVYGRSRALERVASGVMGLVSQWGEEVGATGVNFPPVVPRETFERTNYIESFPDLMGSVHVFEGDDRDHAELLKRLGDGKDWPSMLRPAELMLASAACHPVYPLCSGTLPIEGRRFEVMGYCFRHEPSIDPARLQSFRMQEVVHVGDPGSARAHRDEGLGFGLAMLEQLGLEVEPVPANDPFFGRAGRILAAGQLDQELKIEGVTPLYSSEHPTAIMSANCHEDHFAQPFAIRTAEGEVAHSACVAFGIERITLALLQRHGLVPGVWPAPVRRDLRL